MATESIYKRVYIRDRASGERLIEALEEAQKAKCKKIKLSRNISNARKGQIKEMFDK